MANHGSSWNLTTLLLGGGLLPILAAWIRDKVSNLRTAIAHLHDDLEDLIANVADSDPDPWQEMDGAITKMSSCAAVGAQRLSAANERFAAARQYQAAFLIRHNLDRLPRNVVPLNSALLLLLFAVVEGAATALFFLSGGFVAGAGEALALGLLISSVNVVVAGLLGGGVFGRYWNYGLNARENDPVLRTKRIAGRIGAVLTAIALGFLLLASGILRATGEAEALSFTFETIGQAATNFHSLMLWALGISFSILSWIKGLGAFSDPYPGFSEASTTVSTAHDEIHTAFNEATEEIEDIYEEATTRIADLADDVADDRMAFREDLQDIRHQREAILAELESAPDEFVAFREQQLATQRMLGHGSSETASFAQELNEGFETLKAQVPEITDTLSAFANRFQHEREQALVSLANAKISAVSTLNEAYRKALSQPFHSE